MPLQISLPLTKSYSKLLLLLLQIPKKNPTQKTKKQPRQKEICKLKKNVLSLEPSVVLSANGQVDYCQVTAPSTNQAPFFTFRARWSLWELPTLEQVSYSSLNITHNFSQNHRIGKVERDFSLVSSSSQGAKDWLAGALTSEVSMSPACDWRELPH